ncbi:MAG: hypothetical protein FWG80_01975 [Alphaproteobacteria bacterium]|nr:hypothetical protein [Alphaproteobacteria bacterium]
MSIYSTAKAVYRYDAKRIPADINIINRTIDTALGDYKAGRFPDIRKFRTESAYDLFYLLLMAKTHPEIMLTQGCDLNCKPCCTNSGGNAQIVPVADVVNYCTEFSGCRCCTISIGGGEPMLAERAQPGYFQQILQATGGRRLINIMTNANWIDWPDGVRYMNTIYRLYDMHANMAVQLPLTSWHYESPEKCLGKVNSFIGAVDERINANKAQWDQDRLIGVKAFSDTKKLAKKIIKPKNKRLKIVLQNDSPIMMVGRAQPDRSGSAEIGRAPLSEFVSKCKPHGNCLSMTMYFSANDDAFMIDNRSGEMFCTTYKLPDGGYKNNTRLKFELAATIFDSRCRQS